jgi:glyoxylase-like metal-dependent hydrolase (beta-lactamase superfamily II)
VQGFLLKTSGATILWTHVSAITRPSASTAGPGATTAGSLPVSRLPGVTPADVDVVFCTHLHVDHFGWNTRLENGQWVPTFPNARYLFPAEDEAHYGETRARPIPKACFP